MEVPASVMLFYWFFTQLFAGVATVGLATSGMGGVAFFAHAGGFAFGWLIGGLFKKIA